MDESRDWSLKMKMLSDTQSSFGNRASTKCAANAPQLERVRAAAVLSEWEYGQDMFGATECVLPYAHQVLTTGRTGTVVAAEDESDNCTGALFNMGHDCYATLQIIAGVRETFRSVPHSLAVGLPYKTNTPRA